MENGKRSGIAVTVNGMAVKLALIPACRIDGVIRPGAQRQQCQRFGRNRVAGSEADLNLIAASGGAKPEETEHNIPLTGQDGSSRIAGGRVIGGNEDRGAAVATRAAIAFAHKAG